MVVIGIITLVSLWVVPGIKKAYEDFKIGESLDHLNMLTSSFRAYYLIQNEFPEDSGNNYIKQKSVWCIPSRYYTRISRTSNQNDIEYRLNISPYKATSYDIDNWFSNKEKQFFVSIYKHNNSNGWYQRLQEKYPMYRIYLTNGKSACLGFPDVDSTYVTDNNNFRNRFY